MVHPPPPRPTLPQPRLSLLPANVGQKEFIPFYHICDDCKTAGRIALTGRMEVTDGAAVTVSDATSAEARVADRTAVSLTDKTGAAGGTEVGVTVSEKEAADSDGCPCRHGLPVDEGWSWVIMAGECVSAGRGGLASDAHCLTVSRLTVFVISIGNIQGGGRKFLGHFKCHFRSQTSFGSIK